MRNFPRMPHSTPSRNRAYPVKIDVYYIWTCWCVAQTPPDWLYVTPSGFSPRLARCGDQLLEAAIGPPCHSAAISTLITHVDVSDNSRTDKSRIFPVAAKMGP